MPPDRATCATSGAAVAGQYANIGTVTGVDNTNTVGTPVTASNPDHYFGVQPAIQIVKLTNGTNNDLPTGPLVPAGSVVTWTYNVTNPGNVPLRNVTVTDNKPGVNPAPVLVGGFNTGDGDQDNLLDPGESWLYRASGVAV